MTSPANIIDASDSAKTDAIYAAIAAAVNGTGADGLMALAMIMGQFDHETIMAVASLADNVRRAEAMKGMVM